MVIGGPARSCSQETGGSPRFLGNPYTYMPRSSTPVGRLLLAMTRETGAAFQSPKTVGPTRRYFRGSITRPACSLSTLHRVGRPGTAQDSLPARWLSFGWTGLSPVGFRNRFPGVCYILLSQRSRLAWRTRIPTFHDGDCRIGRTQINAYCLCHTSPLYA